MLIFKSLIGTLETPFSVRPCVGFDCWDELRTRINLLFFLAHSDRAIKKKEIPDVKEKRRQEENINDSFFIFINMSNKKCGPFFRNESLSSPPNGGQEL